MIPIHLPPIGETLGPRGHQLLRSTHVSLRLFERFPQGDLRRIETVRAPGVGEKEGVRKTPIKLLEVLGV